MLTEDNLKASGVDRKYVLEKIMYLKSQIVTSFSFEELIIAINYYDNTNNTEIKEDTLDFPIDITMKVSDDPDDVMNVSQSLSNIDNKFYRALAMFQIKDFQTAK